MRPLILALALHVALVGTLLGEGRKTRRALIITNADYRVTPLDGPLADFKEINEALTAVEFEITPRQNLRDKTGLEKAITTFIESLESGDVALIYYAGHGHQFNGENYLVPVDAVASTPQKAADLSVSLKFIFEKLSEADTNLNIVILDACRANPFAAASGQPDQWEDGLAKPPKLPDETIVVYPVGLGETTKDSAVGTAFTRALSNQVLSPGNDVDTVFIKVADELVRIGLPRPHIEKNFSRPFLFRDPIRVTFAFDHADDDAIVELDGMNVVSFRNQGNTPREVTLRAGDNRVVVKVHNEARYEGGREPITISGTRILLGDPEGWNYGVLVKRGDEVIWRADDAEHPVDDRGPRFGKTFVAAEVNLFVDPTGREVTITKRDERRVEHPR